MTDFWDIRPHDGHTVLSSKQKTQKHLKSCFIPFLPLPQSKEAKKECESQRPNCPTLQISSKGILSTPGRVTEFEMGRDEIGRGCTAHSLCFQYCVTEVQLKKQFLVGCFCMETEGMMKESLSVGSWQVLAVLAASTYQRVNTSQVAGRSLHWGSPRCVSVPERSLQSQVYLKQHVVHREQSNLNDSVILYEVCWDTAHYHHLFSFFSIQTVTLCSQKKNPQILQKTIFTTAYSPEPVFEFPH